MGLSEDQSKFTSKNQETEHDRKQALEILRVSARFFIVNQTTIRSSLIPFVFLSILGFAISIDSSLLNINHITGSDNSTLPPPFTMPITPTAVSIGLIFLFARFGFSLFHGIDLACANKTLIVESKFNPTEEFTLLCSFKDAYLTDSFLIFLNEHRSIDKENLISKRILSYVINIILVCVLILGQSIVIVILSNINYYIAVTTSFIYFMLFSVFFMKLNDVSRIYSSIAEKNVLPRQFLLSLYVFQCLISAVASFLILRCYWGKPAGIGFEKFSLSSKCFF